ncbi:MAG: hypothetical protein ACD_43C00246G0003 [uncultured bacterium]|nr:MAG: hypothetical protein ACD_43C00246G0003 [uncultured bacterium]
MRNLIERIQRWIDGLSDTQKRLVLAAILLVAALIIGFIIYWIFFRSLIGPGEEKVNINGQLVNVSQLPQIIDNFNGVIPENANITLPQVDAVANGGNTLSQVIYGNDAEAVTLSKDGKNLQYYDPITDQFYTIDENGNVTLLDEQKFPGVIDVTWSNEADKAVLELEDGFKVLYDFTQDKQYTLNKDMNEFDFAPNDNQISFKFTPTNKEDRWLGVANTDGSGAVGIEPLGEYQDSVNAQWSPSGQSVGVMYEYVDGQRQRVVPLGFKGENFKQFLVDGRGFDYRWTSDGKQMLYSVYSANSNYNDSLYLVDAYGDEIGNNNRAVGLNTSVDKCTFSGNGDAAYCAVPVDPATGGGIAPAILNETAHDIYKVNLVTGQTEKIATPTDASGATDLEAPSTLVVSDDGNVLYYREAVTGNLRRILLK